MFTQLYLTKYIDTATVICTCFTYVYEEALLKAQKDFGVETDIAENEITVIAEAYAIWYTVESFSISGLKT